MLEEFKRSVPENVVIHLNEQKVTSIVDAAVLADEFTLTHWNVFFTPQRNAMFSTSINTDQDVRSVLSHTKPSTQPSQPSSPCKKNVKRACFFCLDPNHLISECWAGNRKLLLHTLKVQLWCTPLVTLIDTISCARDWHGLS